MKKFSLLATVFAAVGLFSSVAAQAEIKPVTLKFAHIYAAQDHWGQTAALKSVRAGKSRSISTPMA